MASFCENQEKLPTLGVGVSLSFGVEPDPVVLAQRKGGPSFIEYAGAVQHSWMRQSIRTLQEKNVPMLYHPSCLNLCGPFPNPSGWLRAIQQHLEAVQSPWLAQDVSICFASQIPGYSNQLGYFIPPILNKASLNQAITRVREVVEAVGVPLLLEPPPVQFVVGDMDIFSWLGELAVATDCGLLLDAGHVVSHQFSMGRTHGELLFGLNELPLERVIEVHVAGGTIVEQDGKLYYGDAHDLPILPETMQVLRALIGRCKNLRAVCFECEGALTQSVLPMLKNLRQLIGRTACNLDLVEKVSTSLQKSLV